jgi:WD40 repeat protein
MQSHSSDQADEKPVLSHIRGKAGCELVAPVNCVALPNGNIAISHSGSSQLTLWDPETQQCVKTIYVKSEITGVALWTNNRLLITHKGSRKPFVYDIAKDQEDVTLMYSWRFSDAALYYYQDTSFVTFPNGNCCENFDDGTLGFYKPAYTAIRSPYSERLHKNTPLSDNCLISFRRDGNSIFIFNIAEEKFVKEARLRDDKFYHYDANIAVLSDQYFVLTLSGKKDIEIYRINEKFDLSLVKRIFTNQAYRGVVALPDKQHFVTTNAAGQIQLWDRQSNTPLDTYDTYQVAANLNQANYLQLANLNQTNYLQFLAVRPDDGKVVYITSEYEMGIIEYACMKNHFCALELGKVLFEMKNDKKKAYFPVEIAKIIGEYSTKEPCYAQLFSKLKSEEAEARARQLGKSKSEEAEARARQLSKSKSEEATAKQPVVQQCCCIM